MTRRATAAGWVEYQYDPAGNQTVADAPGGEATDRLIRYDGGGNADRITVGPSATPVSTTEFRYASGGRYLRLDTQGGQTTTTRYLGSVEWITTPTTVERKRYIGGFLILLETGPINAPSRQYRYTLTDHLGSLDVLVNEQGAVLERMSFDAHGSRRVADGANSWSGLITNYPAPTTKRGFTGHEHVDNAGIVHMNGRLYDAALGRMLSPDPIVQEPYNTQNLNRYTYVLNNPLSFTDPSGLNFIKKYWRTIVSIAINIFLPGVGLIANGFWNAVLTGFISGVVGSGSLQAGLWGAFSAGVFNSIGGEFAKIAGDPGTKFLGTGLEAGQFAAKVLAHATAGGVLSTLQGGKFGHGFASAGVAQAFSPAIDRLDPGNDGISAVRVTAAAMVGGTSSVLSGGKFANGAITAAFARAFNDDGDHSKRVDDSDDIATLTKDETIALSKGTRAYARMIKGLTTDEFLKRFPEAEHWVVGFGDRDGAAFIGKKFLYGYLGELEMKSTAKVLTIAVSDALNGAVSDAFVGPAIKLTGRMAGRAWDVYDYSGKAGIFSSFVRNPGVSFACNVDAGCVAAIQR